MTYINIEKGRANIADSKYKTVRKLELLLGKEVIEIADKEINK